MPSLIHKVQYVARLTQCISSRKKFFYLIFATMALAFGWCEVQKALGFEIACWQEPQIKNVLISFLKRRPCRLPLAARCFVQWLGRSLQQQSHALLLCANLVRPCTLGHDGDLARLALIPLLPGTR